MPYFSAFLAETCPFSDAIVHYDNPAPGKDRARTMRIGVRGPGAPLCQAPRAGCYLMLALPRSPRGAALPPFGKARRSPRGGLFVESSYRRLPAIP